MDNKQAGSMYLYATIIVTIFVLAPLWFILNEVFLTFQGVGQNISTAIGSGGPIYTGIDAFMGYLWYWLLILAVLGLGFWVYLYAQRKGERF